MQVPPVIAFHHLEPADDIREAILDGIDDLEAIYSGLISCRTVVADDTPAQRSGKNFRVRVELSIPGHTLVAEEKNNDPESQRSLRQTLKDAFDVLEARLKKAKDRQRGATKTRELPPHGRVRRLLTDETGVRYGFIESREGRQVYFHEDALVDLDYEELEVGDEVRLAVAEGDEGPQASTVARLPASDIGPGQKEDVPLRAEP